MRVVATTGQCVENFLKFVQDELWNQDLRLAVLENLGSWFRGRFSSISTFLFQFKLVRVKPGTTTLSKTQRNLVSSFSPRVFNISFHCHLLTFCKVKLWNSDSAQHDSSSYEKLGSLARLGNLRSKFCEILAEHFTANNSP